LLYHDIRFVFMYLCRVNGNQGSDVNTEQLTSRLTPYHTTSHTIAVVCICRIWTSHGSSQILLFS